MALDDRIRTSVDQAIQALASDLLSIHTDETARQLAQAEERLTEVEQRLRAEFDQKIAEVEAAQQGVTDEAVQTAVAAEREAVLIEAEQRLASEVDAAARAASAQLLADAEQRFELQLRAIEHQRHAAVAEAEARGAASLQASMDAARAGEREAELTALARLVESIRGLDGATSLSEVLDALALAAAREASRAAVVVVKGDHAVGWRVSGFGARDTQPKSIDIPLSEAGLIGVAASSSRAATTRGGAADGPGFEDLGADRLGVAMPVLVGGRAVAVLYGDGAGEGPEALSAGPWPEALEVLARHAGRCLEALTAQKVSAPSAAARKLSGVHSAEGAVGAAG